MHSLLTPRKILSALSITIPLLIIGTGVLISFNTNPSYFNQPTPTNQVLGEKTFQTFIEADGNRYGSNVVIGQSFLAQPAIFISAYDTSGDAEVTIYKATRDDILQILTYKKVSEYQSFDQSIPLLITDNREKVYQTNLEFKPEGKDSRVNLPLENQKGIWLIELTHKNQKRHALLIRSGFGVYTQATERDYLFWAQDYQTGESISEANLKLYSTKDSVKELSARTLNNQGILQQEMQPEVDFALVEKDQDIALVPINLTEISYGGSYKQFSKYQKQNNYFVFTDRPLYKPGDKVLYKAIIRDELDRVYTPATGIANVKIFEGWDDSKPIYEKNLNLDSQGHLNGEFTLPDNLKTGYYNLSVTMSDQSGQSTYIYSNRVSFNVEYYRKPEYSIQLTTDTIEYIRGEEAKVKVKASYFSGEPVRDQVAKYTIRSGSFNQYYYSNNISLDQQVSYYGDNLYGKELYKSDVRLDQNGEAEIIIDTSIKDNNGDDEIWSISAELGTLGESSTFSFQNLLIRNSEFKLIPDQKYQWGGKINTPQVVNLALIPNKNLNQNITHNKQIEVQTEITQWQEFTNPNFKFPQYKEIKSTLKSSSITSDQSGKIQYSFNPEVSGTYKITFSLTDTKGNRTLRHEYRYISDTTYYESYNQYGNFREYEYIKVTQDKDKYQIGDVANLNISLPSQRKNVLMSINGQFADRYQVLLMDNLSQEIPIALQPNDIPNRFVKFITFSNGDFHSTTKNIEVDPAIKKINITITPEKTITSPAETITFNVETKDVTGNPVSANVTLWSVDKALFQLLSSNTSEIFSRFWSKRYFSDVSTHSLEGIFINMAEGGGGGGEGAEIRGNLKDTGYWNPHIQTGSDGRSSVKVKMPDNLTTWVFAAVAANEQTQVGQTTTEVAVTKDIIVRPIIPNVLFEGDKLKLSSLVYNGLPRTETFDTSLKIEGASVENAVQQSQIESKKTAQLFWNVLVEKINPQSKVIVQTIAKSNPQNGDGIELPLPILPVETTQQIGQSAINNHSYTINIPKNLNKDKSEATITLSNSLSGNTVSAMEYLIGYPYGCTEQTMSKLVPLIIAKKRPDLYGKSLQKYESSIDKMFAEGMNRLSENQLPTGGFSWWGTGEANPLVSAYVAEYLIEAQKLGFEIDTHVTTRLEYYFSNLKTKTNDEHVINSYARNLFAKPVSRIYNYTYENLTNDMLARSVITNVLSGEKNPAQNGAKLLRERASVQGDRIYWVGGIPHYFASDSGTTALAIRALYLEGTYKQDAIKALNYLVRNKKSHYWSNSYATSLVLSTVAEIESPSVTTVSRFTIKNDEKVIRTGVISAANPDATTITIPIKDLESSKNLIIEKEGQPDLFSTFVFKQVLTGQDLDPINNGLQISRKYISEKGENYSLTVGDKVTVELKISGLSDTGLYAVVEDTLPAGLVPINTVFNNENTKQIESSYRVFESDREYTKNGIIISLTRIPSGSFNLNYQARVVAQGEFTAPPAFAELMYQPEVNATSSTNKVIVDSQSKKLYELPFNQDNSTLLDAITKPSPKTVIAVLLLTGAAIIGFIGIFVIKRKRIKEKSQHKDEISDL